MSPRQLDLAQVRAQLLRARETLLHRQGDQRSEEDELLGVREPDPADAAAAEGNAIPLDSLNQSERVRLSDIADALERVDAGRYGVCERCGRPIGERRLEAVPWARRCFACELEFEKEHRSVHQM